jgi:uncharacterized protein YndB with AHSA1/START domain/DNA-binding transcriptional ArsR family regulator
MMDDVFKALADPSRRELLDRLNARNGQTLTELGAGLGMARQSVTKHLAILEAADLITTQRRGREKLHFLNSAPINDIADRWIDRYDRPRAQALADLKYALEDETMSENTFVYATYIKASADKVWAAMTNPDITAKYWGERMHSDWKKGSPITFEGNEPDDRVVVLESDPPNRLSYVWPTYQPRHREHFGCNDDELAKLQAEPLSRVTIEIESVGDDTVRMTLTHDGFDHTTLMLESVSGGWPAVLSNLKTMLETGEPMQL